MTASDQVARRTPRRIQPSLQHVWQQPGSLLDRSVEAGLHGQAYCSSDTVDAHAPSIQGARPCLQSLAACARTRRTCAGCRSRWAPRGPRGRPMQRPHTRARSSRPRAARSGAPPRPPPQTTAPTRPHAASSRASAAAARPWARPWPPRSAPAARRGRALPLCSRMPGAAAGCTLPGRAGPRPPAAASAVLDKRAPAAHPAKQEADTAYRSDRCQRSQHTPTIDLMRCNNVQGAGHKLQRCSALRARPCAHAPARQVGGAVGRQNATAEPAGAKRQAQALLEPCCGAPARCRAQRRAARTARWRRAPRGRPRRRRAGAAARRRRRTCRRSPAARRAAAGPSCAAAPRPPPAAPAPAPAPAPRKSTLTLTAPPRLYRRASAALSAQPRQRQHLRRRCCRSSAVRSQQRGSPQPLRSAVACTRCELRAGRQAPVARPLPGRGRLCGHPHAGTVRITGEPCSQP